MSLLGDRRSRGGVSPLQIALGLALVMTPGGCSFVSRSPTPESVGPPIVFYAPDTSAVEIAGPPETVAPEETVLTPPPSSTASSSPRRFEPVKPDSVSVDAPADSIAEPAPEVSIDLPDAARDQLWRVATDDLAAATALLEAAAARIVTQEGMKDLETVRGLIDQAQAALERKDPQAAANLAQKARILGEKLPDH